MKTLNLLVQLNEGNYLNDQELKEVERLLYNLTNELKSRKPHVIEFTRVNADTYGNPRHVCHFTEISDDYLKAVRLANKIGGRKFHNKQYGGGIVFQSYNLDNTRKAIAGIKEN